MAVVETDEFLRKAKPLMSEAEREELVTFMGANPEAGKIVLETGGVRKVRWGLPGRGKRGGARIIYYYHSEGYLSSCCPHSRKTKRRISARPSAMR